MFTDNHMQIKTGSWSSLRLVKTLWKCGGVPIISPSEDWSDLAAKRAASGGSTAQTGPLFQTVQCLSRGMNKTQTQKACEEYMCVWAYPRLLLSLNSPSPHTHTHTTNSTTSASEPRLTHPHIYNTQPNPPPLSLSLLPYFFLSLTQVSLAAEIGTCMVRFRLRCHLTSVWHPVGRWVYECHKLIMKKEDFDK